MKRKSAHRGSRSADVTSPDGSDNKRLKGARKATSASSLSEKKGGMRKRTPEKKKDVGDKNRANRDGGPGNWSPNVDARRETREERALRRDDKRPRPDNQTGHKGKGRDPGGDEPHRGGKSATGYGKARPQSARMYGNRPARSINPDKPKGPAYTPPTRALEEGERIAKIMARAGLCSRRDAEEWIKAGRVSVNDKVLESPAVNIQVTDKVMVDGAPLPVRERTRLWLFHKPRGLVTTTSDPEGRTTVFEKLPEGLPRVITVGRLDINTEGLLLLTNDGGLARILELPSTGWLRRYRVRAYGKVSQQQLDTLADGIALDGVLYGSIDAQLEREVGDNVWITVALREGKNREVKKVLGHLGLDVNRLIRVSYGPFQLLDLEEGKVTEVRGRILRDQLGERLIAEAGADFDAPILTEAPVAPTRETPPKARKDSRKSSEEGRSGYLSAKEGARAMNERAIGKKRRDADDRYPDRQPKDQTGREMIRGNAIPYAERKTFDPTAPRRTSYTYREDGADGKKAGSRQVRKVGGKPQKADLLDPNARIEKRKPQFDRSGEPGKKTGWDNRGGRKGRGRPNERRPAGRNRPRNRSDRD